MSNLFITEEYKVMQCPNCSKYVSSTLDKCTACSTVITDEIRHLAIEKQEKAVRDAQISFYKNMLVVGLIIFVVGGLLLTSSIVSIYLTNQGRFFIWSPILTLLGLGQIIYSLTGIYKEKR